MSPVGTGRAGPAAGAPCAPGAGPRGPEPSPPGERFRRAVLSAMPDIDAMEVVERFFAIGTKVVGSPNPVAMFLAGCHGCLADWEVHAARGCAWSASPGEPGGECLDKATESAVPGRGPESKRGFCPRGQTGRGRNGHGGAMKRRTRIGARARRRILAGGPRATGRRAASLEEWAPQVGRAP